MYIYKHMLVGSNVTQYWNKKKSTPFKNLSAIVVSNTEGDSATQHCRRLCALKSPLSKHIIINRDGQIIQMIDFQTQGRLSLRCSFSQKENHNASSIGIALENSGLLSKQDDKYFNWFGQRIPDDQVCFVHNDYWHSFTNQQLDTFNTLCQLLIGAYNISAIHLLSNLNPTLPNIPGPHLKVDKIRRLILKHKLKIES